MSITIDAGEPRTIKAVEIAAGAAQWLKVRSKDGRPLAYGIPSQRSRGVYHLTNCDGCTCYDSRRHPGSACKHVLAVRLHCELVRARKSRRRSGRRSGTA